MVDNDNCWKLIRLIYHDNINMINPVIELLKILPIDSEISRQMRLNLYQASDTLKNARILAHLKEKTQMKSLTCSLQDILEPIINRIEERYATAEQIKIYNQQTLNQTYIETDIGMFETLLENLILNAYRFSNLCHLNTLNKTIIIENQTNEDARSLFEMPIKTDRFGITGSGLGLKVVKSISEKLKIPINSTYNENTLAVQIDISSIVR